ncbi:cache domain-containing protein [Arthrobacter sedimenti]|uniref:cache domain-containing protein n=1 Tax=Arthrobacter sedimenti TaxID=2694931 RepID=UPI000B351921|nr:cache domain-containing protein [Arthrobacter sedimenti]OUM42690.1 hypothetical protein B8W73_07660 [Arthrobacter agilis]
MDVTTELSPALTRIRAQIGGVQSGLAGWAVELGHHLAGVRGKVHGSAIDALALPAVEALLGDADRYITGAGFIAGSGLVAADRSYIAWWQGPDLERVDALANFSTSSMDRYLKAEWFRVPFETGKPHATGPYIDFLCTDEYVMTFTHPVVLQPGGPVAGIVGADISVQSLERMLLGSLTALGPAATLVNKGGRVIVSAADALEPGDLVAEGVFTTSLDIGDHLVLLLDTVT